MKKISAILLSLILTIIASGFSTVDNAASNNLLGGNAVQTYSNEIGKYDGEETGEYLLQNGISGYFIVLPNNYTGVENTASQELLLMFYESTGVKLTVVNEKNYKGNSAIYLGNTEYKNQVDVTFNDEQLGESGFRILRKDKNIIIYGLTDTGTLYGTYAFLTDIINFEAFTQTYYYVDENVKEIKLKNYDVVDIPDIQVRLTQNQYLVNDKTLASRMRIVTTHDYFGAFGGKLFHNTFSSAKGEENLGVLPKATYQKDHNDWYADNGLTLCYTARGNAVEYEAMQEEVLKKLKDTIIKNPDYDRINFTHTDVQTWCTCSNCKDIIEDYGNANSVTIIHFMNDLRTRLDEWFEGDGAEYKRDIDLVFFAYHATNKPPVKFNETLKVYEPIDHTVELKDGVVPLFAESNNDYTHSYYESETKVYAENYKGWHALTDKIIMWAHVLNFSHKYTIFDNFSSSPENYKFYTENGTEALFEEGGYTGLPTAFHVLRTYLFSKLSWDCSADVNALINRFFKLYFRSAEQQMRAVFDAYRQLAVIQKDLGYGGERVIFHNATDQKYWPCRTLVQWYNLIDKALNEIEEIKLEDATLYNNLYDNITAERLAVIYPMLALWDEKFTDEELTKFRDQFYEDCTRLGHVNSETFYSNIGIKR